MLPAGPRGALPAPAAQGQPQASAPKAPTLIDRMRESDPDATADVEMLFNMLPQDLGFHTQEWVQILFNLHCKLDPHELAEITTQHIGNCIRFDSLPVPLRGTGEVPDIIADPEGTLRRFLREPMPIAVKDPAYLEEVIVALAESIRENLVLDEDGSEPEGSEAEVVVTPPPAKRATA